ASLVNSELFGKSSMFHTLLEATGLSYHTDPVMQSLRRIGAASFMNRNFIQVEPILARDTVRIILDNNPEWILIKGDQDQMALMPAVDLLRIMEQQEEEEFDLLSLPATRYELAQLRMQATLQEALEKLDNSQADALYIEWYDQDHYWRIQGILTRPLIESAYHF
ncbi:MAG: chloride channel protein, partial [Candidatus Thiodiazotropha sp.]